jgi:hypothetical protein
MLQVRATEINQPFWHLKYYVKPDIRLSVILAILISWKLFAFDLNEQQFHVPQQHNIIKDSTVASLLIQGECYLATRTLPWGQ